uniref:C-type lectin domain-containing protein n=1 Tax=Cyprinodon variegatus TaxID=28743 RepID=A0A3Q2DE14_CYPVA
MGYEKASGLFSFFSDCLGLSTTISRHYYFFSQPSTWSDAQTFCRQKHTDLATIENSKELDLLYKTLLSAGHSSDVWIGLYNEIDWKWSDGYTGTGTDYRQWKTFLSCEKQLPFYYFVNQSLNWTEAQTYCRQKHTDLASILNSEQQNQLIDTLTSAGQSSDVWIGLFSKIHWKWSDGYTGSGADYRCWSTSNPPGFSHSDELCVVSYQSGTWFDARCSNNRPFLCCNGKNDKL